MPSTTSRSTGTNNGLILDQHGQRRTCPAHQRDPSISLLPMGIGRFNLDLPAGTSSEAAMRAAESRLSELGVKAWSKLELQTTLTTGSPHVSTYTFTYWDETA